MRRRWPWGRKPRPRRRRRSRSSWTPPPPVWRGSGWRSPAGSDTAVTATTTRSSSATPSPPRRRATSGRSATSATPPPGGIPLTHPRSGLLTTFASSSQRVLWVGGRPDEEEDIKARCHYSSAKVDGTLYCLHDDVYVKVHHPISISFLPSFLYYVLPCFVSML